MHCVIVCVEPPFTNMLVISLYLLQFWNHQRNKLLKFIKLGKFQLNKISTFPTNIPSKITGKSYKLLRLKESVILSVNKCENIDIFRAWMNNRRSLRCAKPQKPNFSMCKSTYSKYQVLRTVRLDLGKPDQTFNFFSTLTCRCHLAHSH